LKEEGEVVFNSFYHFEAAEQSPPNCSNKSNYSNSDQRSLEKIKSIPNFSQLVENYTNQLQFVSIFMKTESELHKNLNKIQDEKIFDLKNDFIFNKNFAVGNQTNKNNTIACYANSVENWDDDLSNNFFLKKKKNFLEDICFEEKPKKDDGFNFSINYEMISTDEESPLQEKINNKKFIRNIYKGNNNSNNNNNNNSHN
jgi:hypothetical protein